jgi:glycosyltransferase involved in cell wall biosynthesis
MRICLVSASINPHAGLGRAVLSVADGLAARGHEVGIVSEGCVEGYPFCSISVKQNLKNPTLLFFKLYKIRKFLKRYDIVVAYDPRPVGILVHFACIGLRKKIVIQTLGTYALFEDGFIKNRLIEWTYKRSYRVFLINTFVKRRIEMSNKKFSFSDNISYVPVGVDTKYFLNKKVNRGNRKRSYILSVGAIKPRKGQGTSIEAFLKIAASFPDLDYVLAGSYNDDSRYMKEIRKKISDSGIENRIIFVQAATDHELVELYASALLFVLTPISTGKNIEGFGMVYLEAALFGVPAIGTLDTGAEAAIENNRSGVLVASNVIDISKAMSRLLNDSELRNQYGAYAKIRSKSFDWAHVIDRYEEELTHNNL